jgi:hypothetical protein
MPDPSCACTVGLRVQPWSRRILLHIAQAGTPAAAIREFSTFAEFVDFIGLSQVHQAEQRYAVKPAETGSETGGRDGSDV